VSTTTTNTLLADNRFLPQRQQQQTLSFTQSLVLKTHHLSFCHCRHSIVYSSLMTFLSSHSRRHSHKFNQTFAPFYLYDLSLTTQA
jgi:hypothetical protein